MFKDLGNLAALIKQAQEMTGRVGEINDLLRTQRAVGRAGGDMIEVEVNGLAEVIRVKIDPSLVEKGDLEMIQDLLPAAINQASEKANELRAEAMKSLAGGIDMPGLDEALGKFLGGGPLS